MESLEVLKQRKVLWQVQHEQHRQSAETKPKQEREFWKVNLFERVVGESSLIFYVLDRWI